MQIDLLVVGLLRKGNTCTLWKVAPGEQGLLKDTSASPLAGTAMPRAESSWASRPRSATSRLSYKEAGELNTAPRQKSFWRAG